MNDEELAELRAELGQLREFKRVVLENFGGLVPKPNPASVSRTDDHALHTRLFNEMVENSGTCPVCLNGSEGTHDSCRVAVLEHIEQHRE